MGRIAVASGDILESVQYIVIGGNITYNSVSVVDGDTFIGVTGVDTFTTDTGTPEVFEDSEIQGLSLEYIEPLDLRNRFPEETELINLELEVDPFGVPRFPEETELQGLSMELQFRRAKTQTIKKVWKTWL